MEEDFFDKILNNLKSLKGQKLSGGMQKSKIRLAEDERGAWINSMADQYNLRQPVPTPPPELNITTQDVVNELVRRKVREAFGSN